MDSWNSYLKSEGLLLVVSGPSGVGKDSVLEELEKKYSLCRCVTTTTRFPRENEEDGVDYTFISRDEFLSLVRQNAFLEHANVYGNLYGTPRAWVERKTQKGIDVVLKIDVQGALAVKKQMPSSVLIFIVPPSMEVLEQRLRDRKTENETELLKRLKTAEEELAHISEYDYIIENNTLAKSADDLRAVIIAEHCRIK